LEWFPFSKVGIAEICDRQTEPDYKVVLEAGIPVLREKRPNMHRNSLDDTTYFFTSGPDCTEKSSIVSLGS
jgi:hypothetical protein